jgi:hypothetical protein
MTTLLDIISGIVYFIISLLIITVIGIVYVGSVFIVLLNEFINYIRHKLK